MTDPIVYRIQRIVARTFGLSIREMLGPFKERRYSRPRQIAMYLSRELTDRSWAVIGDQFDGRDHATAIHAHKAIASLIAEDRGVAGVVDMLWEEITKLAERE